MKLLKQKTREYKGTDYFKHWVIIPNDVVQELGWGEGQELKETVNGDKITIEPKKEESNE